MNLSDEFIVDAPADKVWTFFTDPHRIAAALPGARITEQLDDTTFQGNMAVHGGSFSANYEGTFTFDAYEESRQSVVQASGDGGMGSADVRITSQVTEVSEGTTRVYVDADIGISGVIAQVAGGIIEQASKKMFKEFGAAVKRALETG